MINFKDFLFDWLIFSVIFYDGVVMFFVGGVGFYDSGVGVFEVFRGVYVYEFVEFVVVVIKYFFDFVGAVIDGVENLAVY